MALPPHYPGIDPKLKYHPFATHYMMSERDLELLARDIERNSQLQPITLYEGKILDGRNRYAAIALLNKQRVKQGKKPIAVLRGEFGAKSQVNDELAKKLITSLNFYRY